MQHHLQSAQNSALLSKTSGFIPPVTNSNFDRALITIRSLSYSFSGRSPSTQDSIRNFSNVLIQGFCSVARMMSPETVGVSFHSLIAQMTSAGGGSEL